MIGRVKHSIWLLSVGVVAGVITKLVFNKMKEKVDRANRRRHEKIWEVEELEEHMRSLKGKKRTVEEEVHDFSKSFIVKGKLNTNEPLRLTYEPKSADEKQVAQRIEDGYKQGYIYLVI